MAHTKKLPEPTVTLEPGKTYYVKRRAGSKETIVITVTHVDETQIEYTVTEKRSRARDQFHIAFEVKQEKITELIDF